MSIGRHPLTLQLEDLFLTSHLPPKINCLLIEGVDAYFKSETIEISDNLPRLIKRLYAIGDNKIYTLVSVCNQDQYRAVLMTPLTHFIRHASKKATSFLKKSGEYSGSTLESSIRDVNNLMKIALDILKDSTLSSRKAIGDDSVREIAYPDYETLKSFYECGRKVKYSSYEEAESHLFRQNKVYLCSICGNYHQGRPTTLKAPPIPDAIKLGRYKTVWRRYHQT